MNVRKFFGANSREALREVKRVLGADAVILSSNNVEGGIEMLALANQDLAALDPERRPATGQLQGRMTPPAPPGRQPTGGAPVAQNAAGSASPGEVLAHRVLGELREMRDVLEERIVGFAWRDMQMRAPVKAKLLHKLLHAGLSPLLARRLLDKMPDAVKDVAALDWVRRTLRGHLGVAADDEMISRGGIYALMGPTGVGKTTTTAKLAARCVVRHGADSLALLTTDTYRVGAHEQLRIFGRILGVPVHAVRNAADLRFALADMRQKRMVLIDTVGMGQRDRLVEEQLEMLGSAPQVQRLLLLNAASSSDALEDVVRVYRGRGLHGAVITKVDEAVRLGPVLDVVIRNRLTLHYLSNGQRVPEDLHPPRVDALLHRALRSVGTRAPYLPTEADVPFLMVPPAEMPAHAVGQI